MEFLKVNRRRSLASLLRRHSFSSSRNLSSPTLGRRDCVTSQKNVCVGGYSLARTPTAAGSNEVDYEQPLFSSLIRRARKKKKRENWGRDERAGKDFRGKRLGARLAPSFRAAIFRSPMCFFFLSRATDYVGKEGLLVV